MKYRWLVLPVLSGALIFLSSDNAWGQFPGGDRGDRDRGSFGGRGGGFTSDSSFDRLVSSYGGTGDVLDYSRVPPESRERTNRFAQMTGSEPMPLTGTITREQYRDVFNKRMEAMRTRGGFGGGPPGGSFGGVPGSTPGAPAFSTTSTTPSPMQPGGFVPPGGFSGGRGGSDAQSYLQERDRNRDGKLDMNEASDRLRGAFQQYDANRDGFVDATEVQNYVNDRQNSRGGPPGSPPMPTPGFVPPQGSPYPQPSYGRDGRDQRRDERRDGQQNGEENLPTVYRYGHLPKEVPSWFSDLDTDKDGQVGLYEWRKAQRATKDYVEMDLNGDCYLTATEWIRYNQLAIEKREKQSNEPAVDAEGNPIAGAGSNGGPRGFGGRDRGGDSRGGRESRGAPASDRGSSGGNERGGERRNPFTGR